MVVEGRQRGQPSRYHSGIIIDPPFDINQLARNNKQYYK